MGATFYICDLKLQASLDKLVEEMEAEDPLEDVEDSAYDRFAQVLEKEQLACRTLDEDASSPAEAFYEFFHERVSDAFDKLYLLPEECRKALETLEKLEKKGGLEKLIKGFWQAEDGYPMEVAQAYLATARELMTEAVQRQGLFAISYR